jgi:hypothetical protein
LRGAGPVGDFYVHHHVFKILPVGGRFDFGFVADYSVLGLFPRFPLCSLWLR